MQRERSEKSPRKASRSTKYVRLVEAYTRVCSVSSGSEGEIVLNPYRLRPSLGVVNYSIAGDHS